MAACASSAATDPPPPPTPSGGPSEVRTTITNKRGEKLVGVLHSAPGSSSSNDLVILCHGFRSSKDSATLVKLASALSAAGRFSAFRFDFAGNGESEGAFRYGNFRGEVEDLHSVVAHFRDKGYNPRAVVGHSKGGNVVVLYASSYGDVPAAAVISGRFDQDRRDAGRLGEGFMGRIEQEGFIDVQDNQGGYRVTKEDLLTDSLTTAELRAACRSVNEQCKVLTVHGSKDSIVPKEDAAETDMEIGTRVRDHKLHIVKGANHGFTSHHRQLASAVLEFLHSE